MKTRKVNVGIVGLGFGAEFIPIYQKHPNAEVYAICRRDEGELDRIGDAFGIDYAFSDIDGAGNAHRISVSWQ